MTSTRFQSVEPGLEPRYLVAALRLAVTSRYVSSHTNAGCKEGYKRTPPEAHPTKGRLHECTNTVDDD